MQDGRRLSRACYKTTICKYWLGHSCTANPCNFAHGSHEIRLAPDLARTKFCPSLVQHGICDNEHCQFAHVRTQMRRFVVTDTQLKAGSGSARLNTRGLSGPENNGVDVRLERDPWVHDALPDPVPDYREIFRAELAPSSLDPEDAPRVTSCTGLGSRLLEPRPYIAPHEELWDERAWNDSETTASQLHDFSDRSLSSARAFVPPQARRVDERHMPVLDDLPRMRSATDPDALQPEYVFLSSGSDAQSSRLLDPARFEHAGEDHDTHNQGRSQTRKGRCAPVKTKLCRFFNRGLCRNGGTCAFAHTQRELRPT